MTCPSCDDELAETAAAVLASLPPDDRDEIDAHREQLRLGPLPAPDNAVRRSRSTVPALRGGLDGSYWSRTPRFLVFHAVDPEHCLVLIAAVIPEQHLTAA